METKYLVRLIGLLGFILLCLLGLLNLSFSAQESSISEKNYVRVEKVDLFNSPEYYEGHKITI